MAARTGRYRDGGRQPHVKEGDQGSGVRDQPQRPASDAQHPTPILHPFLFGITPILFVYAHNVSRIPISPSELLLPVLAVLALTVLLGLTAWLCFRNPLKAGIVVSALLAFFFLFGRIQNIVTPRDLTPGALFAISGVVLVFVIVAVIKLKRGLSELTAALNIMAGVLVLMNLGLLVSSWGVRPHIRPSTNLQSSIPENQSSNVSSLAPRSYPDIYYIILDAFARDDFLKQNYGVDDTPFIDFLTRNGFRVARRSRPNYGQTYLSLASSLNFTYLDTMVQRNESNTENRAPLTRMIADSRVISILKQHGYSTMAFATGYTGTELKNSDVYLAPRWTLSEFQNVLLSTTPLPFLLSLVVRKSQYDLQRELIRYVLQNLPRGARARHPVFVFAHIVCPHPPFVFGPHGESINPPGVFTLTEGGEFQVVDKGHVREDYVKGYADQVTFLIQEVQKTVSRILAASPTSPVIIIQGDHGPGSFLNWDNPSWAALAERFGILNAYHLPPMSSETGECGYSASELETRPSSFVPLPFSDVYDSISPVNTFRVVLNRLFGAGLPLLPDRSYFSAITQPYEFFDMTDSAAYIRAMKQGPGSGLTVIAFPHAAQSPDQPERYCRQLVTIKYGAAGQTVRQFYVKPVNESLTVEQADELYGRYVQNHELPDLGQKFESYVGKGPDGTPVTVLFFYAAGQ